MISPRADLCNVLHDRVLKLNMPEGCQCVAFADDLVVVVEAQDKDLLMMGADSVLDKIHM